MRNTLRRNLTKQQYDWLAKLKIETLPNIAYRLARLPFQVLARPARLLPDVALLSLKSDINIVGRLDYKRHSVFLNVESEIEHRVRLTSCRKEPDTIEWIETFMANGDVLYDVGANVGAYSLVASKFFEGRVSVYSFEPAFLNFAQLCKNVALNRCQESITPFQVALSGETGVETFNLFNLIPGGAVHALGEAVDYQGNGFQPVSTQPVLMYRLDDFIKQFQIPAPNHIKIDVDGTEFSILKGMDATLGSGSVRSMMLELTEGMGDGVQIIDYLSSKGFALHSRNGMNHLLVRKGLSPVDLEQVVAG